MKYLLLFLLLFIGNKTFSQTTKPKDANMQLVHQFFDAVNAHDTTALKNFCDDSIRIESPNWEGVQTGLHAIAVVYSRYFNGTPDIKYSITNIIATKNAAVVEYTFTGTFSNPEKGTPDYMRNKNYSIKSISRIDIENNKIKDLVTYFDQVSFLKQVGFFDQKNN